MPRLKSRFPLSNEQMEAKRRKSEYDKNRRQQRSEEERYAEIHRLRERRRNMTVEQRLAESERMQRVRMARRSRSGQTENASFHSALNIDQDNVVEQCSFGKIDPNCEFCGPMHVAGGNPSDRKFSKCCSKGSVKNDSSATQENCGTLPCEIPHNSCNFKVECIFCHSNKMTTDPCSLIDQYEPLTKCTLAEAENLMKYVAAENNEFKSIRIVSDQDLFSQEAMYHRSCYENYLHNHQPPARGRPALYNESWKYFKTYVRKKLVEENASMTVNHFLEEFKKIIFQVEGLDASSYTTSQLKLHLKTDFPEIIFVQQGSAKNVSETASIPTGSSQYSVTTCETSASSDLSLKLDTSTETSTSSELNTPNEASASSELNIPNEKSTSSELNTPNEASASSELNTPTEKGIEAITKNTDLNIRQELYYAARYLAQKIEKSPSLSVQQSTTAENLIESTALKMIPNDLLDFLAWLFGERDPLYTSNKDTPSLKLLSIAEDIIYLFNRGDLHTPKHLSLAEQTNCGTPFNIKQQR